MNNTASLLSSLNYINAKSTPDSNAFTLAETYQKVHMKDFALDISKLKQERLKAYLFNIGMLSIPIIYDIAFPNSFIKSSYYFFVAGFLLVNLAKETLSEKTFQVSFDEEGSQIILVSKALFSKPKRRAIRFDQARLEYIDEGKFLIFEGNSRLCFMKDKVEVDCINASTRGFNKETIREMMEKAKGYNIPITTV